MTTTSKLVLERVRSQEAVAAAARVWRERIQAEVVALLTPVLGEGEVVPDAGLLAELFVRRMERDAGAMVGADRAHREELADDAPLREARDEAAEEVGASVVELKEIVTGLYGGAALREARLEGEVGREPAALSHRVEDIARALPEAELGRSRMTGVELDRGAWVARLRAEQAPLDAALAQLVVEAREAQQSLAAKEAAIAASDGSFSRAANLTSVLLRVIGQPEPARKVRASRRKPGRRVVDVPGEDGGEGDGEG